MSRWYRAYVGSTVDPKFGLAARSSRRSLPEVMFVWTMILESCAERRSATYRLDRDAAAYLMGCEPGDVSAIVAALEGRGLLAGGQVAAWDRRQFASDSSAERVRKHREARKPAAAKPDVTACNVTVTAETAVTPPDTESDTDTDTEIVDVDARASAASASEPDPADLTDLYGIAKACCEAAGVNPTLPKRITEALNLVKAWQALAPPLEPAEIVEAVRAERARLGGKPVTSLNFFDAAVRAAHSAREATRHGHRHSPDRPSARRPRDGFQAAVSDLLEAHGVGRGAPVAAAGVERIALPAA